MRKLFFVIIGLCISVCVYGQTAAELVSQAKLQPDASKQIKLLSKAITLSPNMTNAYHLRADAYRNLGRHQLAQADYTKTIRLAPKDPFRYYARALLYMDMGRYSAAEADLTQAIKLKPTYWNFYLARAQNAAKQAKYDGAVQDYKTYLEHHKKTNDLSLALAEAYFGAYKYKDAEKELNALLKKEPNNPNVFWLLGRIKQNRGNLDEAVSYYSKAINRDDSYAGAYRYRALAFKDMGDTQAALADYTRLLSFQPDEQIYNRRGIVYEENKDFNNAVADYTRAIELNPKWSLPYNNRGFAKMNLGDWAGAKEDLETAIKLEPAFPTAYINLAGVYWLSKKDKKNTYQNLELAMKYNFKDFDALYDEDKKGWMFKGINKTAEFRAIMYR